MMSGFPEGDHAAPLPNGWLVRVNMGERNGHPTIPIIYVAMYPAPDTAESAVIRQRGQVADREVRAIKRLGQDTIDRWSFSDGDVRPFDLEL